MKNNNSQYKAEWKREDYKKHPEKYKKLSRKFYNDNIEKERERAKVKMKNYYKEQHEKYKSEVLMIYGNGKIACLCCGEKELKFLTLDHIIPIGSKNKNIREKRGFSLYKHLRKNNFPIGYQTLCFNCNCGRSLNKGICPHKEKIIIERVLI